MDRGAKARALSKDILILDEATSNFDMESQIYLNEILEKNFDNKTVILVSHRPDILKRINKILLLHEGMVIKFDNHIDFCISTL